MKRLAQLACGIFILSLLTSVCGCSDRDNPQQPGPNIAPEKPPPPKGGGTFKPKTTPPGM